jgi:hypothetical protein
MNSGEALGQLFDSTQTADWFRELIDSFARRTRGCSVKWWNQDG